MDKEILAGLASILAIAAYLPYFWAILRKHTKPHAFSWIIWSLINGIAATAQYSQGGGVGSIVLAITAIGGLLVAILCIFYGERTVTRFDWIAFSTGIGSIGIWVYTNDPFLSVIVISIIDIAAYFPTFNKVIRSPYEENAFRSLIASAKLLLIYPALEAYNFYTLFYLVIITTAELSLYILILYGRMKLSKTLSIKDFYH